MYTDYTDFLTYGSQSVPEADYPRYALQAARVLDVYTTGIDGVKKLRVAFPTDEDDAELVKACHAELVDLLFSVEQAEKQAEEARGFEVTADGMRGKVIASRSAGNESISYGTSASTGATATAKEKAYADIVERVKLQDNIVYKYLSGIKDANGVNLMYMGRYPYV